MGINILIVDDSATMRLLIRKELESIPNVCFFEAGTGTDAETLIQEQHFMEDPIHLLTLDWVLPEQTGYEVLMNIRASPQFQRLPLVVMITAETYQEQIAAANQLGISAYITKPFTAEALKETVQNALEDGGLIDGI